MTHRRRAHVLARVRTGRPIRETVAEVQARLRDAGWSVSVDIVRRKRALRRAARRAVRKHADLVVVVGGDGAVGQVATRVAGRGIALGVVATGTGNLFAENLGIPTDRAEAIATLLGGHTRPLDVGLVKVDGTRRAFTIALGIGFDAEVMDATEPAQKLRWGQLAYLANAVAQSRGLRNIPHQLTLDGERVELEAAQLFIANMGRMLPLLEPSPPITPDDGLLDVVAVLASGPLPALLAGWEAMRQDALGLSGGGHVYRARARRVRVETRPVRLVEADGSALGRTPIDARIVPAGLCVVVPAP